MTPFVTYTKFYSPEDAQFLASLLQQHHIPYALEHEVNQLDKVYIGDSVEAMFALKIPGDRFKDVHALLAQQAKTDIAQEGFEHYLQAYSVAELQEIVREPAGWSAYDLQVAGELLSEKTKEHVTVPLEPEGDYKPVKLENKWIIVGYLAAIAGITDFFYIGMIGLSFLRDSHNPIKKSAD